MRNVGPRYPRGLCCHEAGHAVVARWFRLDVQSVYVSFEEAKGWYGGMQIPEGSADDLPSEDRITLLSAGKAAEELFICPTHARAWLRDAGEISSLLGRNGVPIDEHRSRTEEGKARARVILEKHRAQALKLIDYLVEHGSLDGDEFLRLMNEVL